MQLVHALIHARVDYCNGLLASCPKYLADKLQSVLRAAARLVLQLPDRSSVTDLMHRQLHWLDIRSRVRFKIDLLVFKCLHGLAPRYLSDYCVPVPVSSTRFSLRSARFQERLLIVPRTRTQTIGPRGFFHASPAIWNSLPDDLHDPELSIGCFRNKWKTFLFFPNLMPSRISRTLFALFSFLIMFIVCRARQRDILLAGAFEMS